MKYLLTVKFEIESDDDVSAREVAKKILKDPGSIACGEPKLQKMKKDSKPQKISLGD